MDDMKKVDKGLEDRARKILTDPSKYLNDLAKKEGYDSCFKINGYDVSPCHEHCKELEKSSFAENCTKAEGFLKCCIR